MSDYDFAVIGGGSAGYAAARTAAALGLKTIVLDGGKEVGGLCILRGCMPSKSLIESANRFRALDRPASSASGHGFQLRRHRDHRPQAAAHRRVRRLPPRATGDGKFEFVRGRASFLDAHTLHVDLLDGTTRTIATRSAIVATGSVVNVPPVPGLAESGAWTSDDVLELTVIPPSLIVLGAGPVALEMAHYFASLGTEVTIIQRSAQLLTGVDLDVARELERALRDRGLEIHTGTSLVKVERESDLAVSPSKRRSHPYRRSSRPAQRPRSPPPSRLSRVGKSRDRRRGQSHCRQRHPANLRAPYLRRRGLLRPVRGRSHRHRTGGARRPERRPGA